ncbi:hypothetical protein NQ317_005919 [Molorchus minor]|uniref:DRBM domain-containing protein n=1 Tax=Molorchus minor TaxID=1323400 RepID=A0ABQ9JES0_9CUCU|nr:hypothetical protein NQ317_005919 [Molorchus minor]
MCPGVPVIVFEILSILLLESYAVKANCKGIVIMSTSIFNNFCGEALCINHLISILQELMMKEKTGFPDYMEDDSDITDAKFKCTVKVGQICASGYGSRKKRQNMKVLKGFRAVRPYRLCQSNKTKNLSLAVIISFLWYLKNVHLLSTTLEKLNEYKRYTWTIISRI